MTCLWCPYEKFKFFKYGHIICAAFLWIIPLIIALNVNSGLLIENYSCPESIVFKYDQGNLTRSEFAWAVIYTNLKVCAFLISGVILSGIPAIGILVYNGFFSGALIRYFLDNELLTVNELLKSSAPHFSEIIGFWLAGSIGLKGITWLRSLIITNKLPDIGSVIFNLRILLIAVILIILSGFIEVYISLA